MQRSGGRKFTCPWESCGKSFNRRSDLCRHHRIHTNERPYQCTFKGCNKMFIQRNALTVHYRTHTGERPYACEYDGCYKAFSDSSSFARHGRVHTRRKPYTCQESLCDKSFSRKETLANHQLREHPPERVLQSCEHTTSNQPPRQIAATTSVLNTRHIYGQLPHCDLPVTQDYSSYLPHDLLMSYATVQQELRPALNIPLLSPFDVPYAQQNVPLMQQYNSQACSSYVIPEIYELTTDGGYGMAERSMITTYLSNMHYSLAA